MSESQAQELLESLADQKIRSDKHMENFESLKAQYINQQEVCQCLQQEYAVLSDQYEQLHAKSQEIIATLQEERDQKITECENLWTQVLTTRQLEEMKQEWMENVEQHLRKKTEANQSELESMRGEYNKLVCSYTFLKSEYESALIDHQRKLKEMKADYDTEISSYAEKLRLAQEENDGVLKVQKIRKLQKLNSELEQRLQSIGGELEEMRTEQKRTLFQTDKVIQEQSEQLATAQTQIKSLEVECSTLSTNLESVKAELSHSLEKQVDLQTAVNQAHRETSRVKRQLEEIETKHRFQISDIEMKMVREYHKLEESRDGVLKEKQAYEVQLELLQRTVHEYEELMTSKEQELELQMQALRESEWGKRVVLEKENTVLEEKVAEEERMKRTAESENRSQCSRLQDHVQELVTHNTALEAEVMSLKAEMQHQKENEQKAETELRMLEEMGYKKKYQSLLSQYQSLHHIKQELEGNCAKLQSIVRALEQAVSDAGKEVLHATETHQQMMDKERHSWQQEKAKLLGRLDDEEVRVRGLMTDIDYVKNHSKKVQKHSKKRMCDMKDALGLAQAKQAELQTEKDSMEKSLTLENMKLKSELAKLKRRQDEFCVLLQTDYFSSSDGLVQGHSMLQQVDAYSETSQSRPS